MSVSSLNRMTVPLANDQSASSQGMLMPKLAYRFRVIFEGMGVSTPRSELTKQVMKFNRPNQEHAEIKVPVYNSVVYLAGRPEWSATEATFRDDASGEVSRLIGEQVQKQQDFMEQASASSGIDYKFNTRLEMLDGGNGTFEPQVLETWELYGCFLTKVDYGNVDYSNGTEIVTITAGIRFDNALQTPLGTGIGSNVGRTIGNVITG